MLAATENRAAVVKALLVAGAGQTRSVEYVQKLTGGAGGNHPRSSSGGISALMLAARQAPSGQAPRSSPAADLTLEEPQYKYRDADRDLRSLRVREDADRNRSTTARLHRHRMRNLAKCEPAERPRTVSAISTSRLLVEGADASTPVTRRPFPTSGARQ
jgi:hypothetical protein